MEAQELDISDEEWAEGASTDEETVSIEQNLPPLTYEDFEAALGGSVNSGKSKSKAKQGGGSVSLNLRDIPKKPMSRPSLSEKPIARPGMQEAAQPPPPPTLGARPRPRDGFVEPTQPSPRVVRNPEPALKKKEPPPPPPLMAAPTKPQAAAPPLPPQPPSSVVNPPAAATANADERSDPAPFSAQKTEAVKEKHVKMEEPVAPEPVQPQQLNSKPRARSPATAPAVSSPSRPSIPNEAAIAEQRNARRARSVQAALDLQANQGQITVKVWQVNAAGLLVANDVKEITGFIPLTELSHVHASAILAEERRLKAAIAENTAAAATSTTTAAPAEGPALRRSAMQILRDQEFLVEVIAIDKESGRVIFSEKAAAQSMSRRPAVTVSPAALVAAAEAVGSLVPCRVRSVRPFGVFVDFPIKLESGKEEIAVGLVHSSEVSWDGNALPASVSGKAPKLPSAGDGAGQILPDFTVGQAVTARLTHVDPKKARIFLSIRRATPNPLLETLDSLLASTGAAATMAPGTAIPGPRQTIDAAVDMRPLLGDLPVAVKFAEAVVEVEGVVSANLGVRLESRASSPDVEVYMAKETGEEASLTDSQDGKFYKLVLRQGRDVQEVEIKCVLDRSAVRDVAGATVAKIGAQPQE